MSLDSLGINLRAKWYIVIAIQLKAIGVILDYIGYIILNAIKG